MSEQKDTGISFFEKYLTVWVALCMVGGILIGKFLPAIPEFLGKLEYANVSIPVAVLIWIMIYPMMMKVDFKSVKHVGENPQGLFITWIVNWLIKPFTMFGISWLFFYVIFKNLIPDSCGSGERLSRRCGFARSSSVYRDGFCMESFNQRHPRLHCGAGGDQ